MNRTTKRHRKPVRTPLLEALEHRLAPAGLQDVLPAALVNSQPALTNAATNINPQVAVDPLNPQKLFEVHSTGGGLSGFYSNGGGWASWGIINNSDLPHFNLTLDTVDPVSVAIDRNEEAYVVFSLHASDNSSGTIADRFKG